MTYINEIDNLKLIASSTEVFLIKIYQTLRLKSESQFYKQTILINKEHMRKLREKLIFTKFYSVTFSVCLLKARSLQFSGCRRMLYVLSVSVLFVLFHCLSQIRHSISSYTFCDV